MVVLGAVSRILCWFTVLYYSLSPSLLLSSSSLLNISLLPHLSICLLHLFSISSPSLFHSRIRPPPQTFFSLFSLDLKIALLYIHVYLFINKRVWTGTFSPYSTQLLQHRNWGEIGGNSTSFSWKPSIGALGVVACKSVVLSSVSECWGG